MKPAGLAPFALTLALVAAGGGHSQSPRADLAALRAAAAEPGAPGATEATWGSEPGQTLDVWRAPSKGAPLVVFVHGGAWSRGDKRNATGAAKVRDALAHGWAFASLNYRLVPQVTVEQQAQDVADALGWLIAHAQTFDVDPNRIVLMGHSAGAHLSALVGTDPSYLAKAGLSPRAVRGVVLLDGAAYDVPRQMAGAGAFMQDAYEAAFGRDPQRQAAVSPMAHVASPNAPAFLILHVQRPDGVAQSRALARALNDAGTPTEIHGFAGQGLMGHMQINRRLGEADYPATSVLDDWLTRRFATP